jgi:hypothetical protein
VELLLDRGADPNFAYGDALTLPLKRGFNGIAKMVLDYGAKVDGGSDSLDLIERMQKAGLIERM